jgi:hypothetical protein
MPWPSAGDRPGPRFGFASLWPPGAGRRAREHRRWRSTRSSRRASSRSRATDPVPPPWGEIASTLAVAGLPGTCREQPASTSGSSASLEARATGCSTTPTSCSRSPIGGRPRCATCTCSRPQKRACVHRCSMGWLLRPGPRSSAAPRNPTRRPRQSNQSDGSDQHLPPGMGTDAARAQSASPDPFHDQPERWRFVEQPQKRRLTRGNRPSTTKAQVV